MFVDMGGGGVDEKITDYYDMGGLQKCGLYCVKSEKRFTFSNKYLKNTKT